MVNRSSPWDNPGNAVFYLVISIIQIAYLIVGLKMYRSRWDLSPIKERAEARIYIVVFVVSSNMITLLWSLLNTISWVGLPCSLISFFMSMLIPIICSSWSVRLVVFYYQYQMIAEKTAFASLQNVNKAFDGVSCKGIRACLHKTLLLRWIPRIVFVVSFLVYLLVFSVHSQWNENLLGRDQTLSNECQRLMSTILNLGCVPIISVSVIVSVYALWKVRDCKENFLAKREIRVVSGVLVYITIMLLAELSDSVNDALYRSNGDYGTGPILVVPSFVLTSYCFIYMCWMTNSREFMAVDSTTSKSSVARRSGFTKSFDVMTTQFLSILEDKEGFSLFQKFLEREWSVENALFWKAARDFREQFETVQDKLAVANQIYGEYIRDNAPLCVNISYGVRQTIVGVFEREEQIQAELFKMAELEVFELMVKDSFRRFVFKQDSGFRGLGERLGFQLS